MYPVQRPWGGNILYLAYSENNTEINVAGVECAGPKGGGQGQAGGENGVRCWGSLQATERPLAFMLHEVETEECEAEAFCDPAFHGAALRYLGEQKNPFRSEFVILGPLDIWGRIISCGGGLFCTL